MDQPPVSQPSQTTRRRGPFATLRQRLIGVAVLALAVAVLLLGVQSWKVVSALVSMESAAIVPLPPSMMSPTPEQEPGYTVAAVESASSDGSYGATRDSANVPPEAEPGNQEITPTPSRDVPSGQSIPAGSTGDQPSRLDIVREVVAAGMAEGDPGRSSVWNGQEVLNVLVLGVDRRAEGGDQNADVIIVARLDLLSHTLTAVSLPRDLFVEVPGTGPDKINGSYNTGVLADPENPVAGVARVRDTVEALLGIGIDGYVMADFDGFKEVVDAMGGVTIDVSNPILDTEYPTEDYGIETVSFEAGVQEMDGETALVYVRTRHSDSDDARRERQLQVIRAIFAQGRSFESIRSADEVILAMAGSVQTSFSLEEQLTLARLAFTMSPDDIHLTTLTEPLLVPGWTDDGRWVYLADPAELRAFVGQHLSGESAGL